MGGKKNNPRSSNIGRRTGKNVLEGKLIRRREDGVDMFDDYWTDSGSESESHISANGSVQDSSAVSPMKPLRSSLKKTVNQGSGEYDDYGGDFSSVVSKKKSLTFSEDVENATIARSKMTQTSHFLDETESSPSKSRKYLTEITMNKDDLSDSEMNSSVRRSARILKETGGTKADSSQNERNSSVRKSRVLSDTFAQNRMEDLPSSTDDTNVVSDALSHEMKSVKRAKRTSNSRVDEEGSPSKNRTYMQISNLKETGGKKADSSHNNRNSYMGRSRVLSNTFAQNRMEHLSIDDTNAANVSLSHEMKSGNKAKNKKNSRVDEVDDSPSKNGTYTQMSYLKETGGKKADSSHNEINSSPRRSPRVLSDTFTQNRMEDLPSSMDDANVLSHEMESGKKTKNKSNSRRDEVEGSPSKNRAYTQISYLKETGGKKADSSRSERISSVVRSGVLTSASSSPNCREKDNKKNSGEKSPQHATESSEVLNHKENILSRKDRSLNRSKIPISHQKEGREDVRKSSVGKSPIAVKRKMQAPNILESNLSNTSRIQYRGDVGHKRNSSGRRSNQHATKSFEVLNQEENIPTRSDKSVGNKRNSSGGRSTQHTTKSTEVLNQENNIPSRSGQILVSSQKEKERRFSIEKSPRASEHNMMQVSNIADSHMKAVKPLNPARRKIVFSETRKDVVQEKGTSPCSVRRSSRKRFPPLASWRNERLKFVKSTSGEIECVGIDKGQPEDDYAYRVLEKKLHERKKIQKPKASNRKRKNIIGKTAILDHKSGKTIKLHLHRPFSTCDWTKPMNDEGFLISKVFSSYLVKFGFLDIAAHSMKDEQYSPEDNIYFSVLKGVVDAVIDKTSFTFQSKDSFIVPVGTLYSISNNTNSSALLNYCAFKVPFFKYQEDD